jgi:hypothetical protein
MRVVYLTGSVRFRLRCRMMRPFGGRDAVRGQADTASKMVKADAPTASGRLK